MQSTCVNDIPLFVDWLAVSLALTLPEVLPISGSTIVEQTPTNIWNRRAIFINDHGDKLLTLLWEPKSSIIRKSSALLEVANEWLYHGRGALAMVNEFVAINSAVVVGVSRVDFAADFILTPERQAVVWGLANSTMYVGGKRSGSGFWSVSNDARLPKRFQGVKIPHCLSWGHKTSAVKWKLYYKWKELCDAAGARGYEKTYIVDIWRELGYPPEEVWRLEVSIKHCNGLTRESERITLDDVNQHAIDIYRAMYAQRFTIRKAQGHADRSNDEVVPFLPIDGALRKVRCSIPVADQPRNAATSLLRNLIKSLDDMPVLVDDDLREGVLWQIENVCTTQHLFAYASAIVGEDVASWIERKRCDALDFFCKT